MNNRRKLVIAIGAGVLTAPFGAFAQQPSKVARIGWLTGGTPASSAQSAQSFREGLRELGHIEGRNIVIESRYSHGKVELFPGFADELVRLNPDCIVAGGFSAVRALTRLTRTIPIVIANIDSDPVREGIVGSLARPGGNVTGLTGIQWELAGKRLELLREIAPKAIHIALLFDPRSRSGHSHVEVTQDIARKLGMQLQVFEVRDPKDIEQAFIAARKGRADAISVIHTGIMGTQRPTIVKLALNARLPAIYSDITFVIDGGLMAYAPDISAQYRSAAVFVDKILKGAKPVDLPIEQPTKFELVINMKTAKVLGITIPQSILVRADRFIE